MNEIGINPTLNGGERTDRLSCGCDPNSAEMNDEGKRRIYLVKQNDTFFAPFGSKNGMRIVICAQCKEITGFQITPPAAPAAPLIVSP